MFGTRHDAGSTTEVDADEFRLNARYSAGDDGADFILKGVEDGVVFGFAEALDYNLFGGASSDAAKGGDLVFFFYGVTDFGIFLDSFSIFMR